MRFNLQVNEITARPGARRRHVGQLFKDFVKVTSDSQSVLHHTPAETQSSKQDMRSQRDVYRHANPQWAGLWTAEPQINLPPVDHLFMCARENKVYLYCVCVYTQ